MKGIKLAAVGAALTIFVIASFALQPTRAEASNNKAVASPTPKPRRSTRRGKSDVMFGDIVISSKSSKRRKRTSNYSWGLNQTGAHAAKSKPRKARRRH